MAMPQEVMSVLLIDGVRYNLWIPPSEDDFEMLVKEHTNDIFGERCVYLDVKKTLRSKSGIGSIPDAYMVVVDGNPTWHIIEVELSTHPLFEHIVTQVSKFLSGIKNPYSQRQLAEALYTEIERNDFLKLRLRKNIGSSEVHKFLSDTIATEPTLTVIIDKETEELREALAMVPCQRKRVIEFETFTRENVGLAVHAHMFEPLFQVIASPYLPVLKVAVPSTQPSQLKSLAITLSNPSCLNFHLFPIPKGGREFFPGYKIPFSIETDVGTYETWVTSAPKGTEVGDPKAGVYVQRNLIDWFKAHTELKVGSRILVEAIEPMKRYSLKTIQES